MLSSDMACIAEQIFKQVSNLLAVALPCKLLHIAALRMLMQRAPDLLSIAGNFASGCSVLAICCSVHSSIHFRFTPRLAPRFTPFQPC